MSLRTKSYGVTSQIKATEQYFPLVLCMFIMLYKVVLTLESLDVVLWCDHSNGISECLAAFSFIRLGVSFPDSPKGPHDKIISLSRPKLSALKYPNVVSTAELMVPTIWLLNIREDSSVFLSLTTPPHLPRCHSKYKLWFKTEDSVKKIISSERLLCKITEIIRYSVIMAVKCCRIKALV